MTEPDPTVSPVGAEAAGADPAPVAGRSEPPAHHWTPPATVERAPAQWYPTAQGWAQAPAGSPDAARWAPAPPDPWSAWPAWPQPWQAPPPPPRTRRAPAAVAAALLLLVALVAGVAAAVGVHVVRTRVGSPSAVAGPNGSARAGGGSALAPVTTLPTPVPGAVTSNLDPAAIAAAVDPAVVDIVTSLDQGQAAGTGMVLTSSGLVLTNNHVIEGGTRITGQLNGTGRVYTVQVLGYSRAQDVALVQLEGASGLPTVTIGDASNLAVGDHVVALGNALGQGGTPAEATATVSALDQTITASDSGGGNAETLTGMIQVRGNIQPGDSGGPVVDTAGRVVGMTTAGSAGSGGRRFGPTTAGTGFAIPISTAMTVAHEVQSGGGTGVQVGPRPVLGVQVDPSQQQGDGVVVTGVQPGGPAARAGVAAGATIVSVGGATITDETSLTNAIRAHRVGDRVSVTWQDTSGASHTATLTLEGGPPD